MEVNPDQVLFVQKEVERQNLIRSVLNPHFLVSVIGLEKCSR